MKEKTLFVVFEGLSFGKKIEIWYKIADLSFNSMFNDLKEVKYFKETTDLKSLLM